MSKSQATSARDFDWQQLYQLADEDTEFEVELLTIFLQDAENSLDKLERAIAAQDVRSTEVVAHSLRGASANVGAIALAATAAQLEQIARGGSIAGAQALLQQLRRHCCGVQAHLQSRRLAR